MKQEYSYGAVVYVIKEGRRHYLLEKMRIGHISMPKGHIEKGETPRMCALREIKEETDLDVELDSSFSRTITYSPKPGVTKDVTFYIAKAFSCEVKPQKEEVSEIVFVPVEEAVSLLTHKSDKEVLVSVDSYLERSTRD